MEHLLVGAAPASAHDPVFTEHIPLAFFAGFAGAYVLGMVGYWLEGVLRLPRFDIAESGKRYLGGEVRGWWAVGMLTHLVNGALMGVLYAGVVYPRVTARGGGVGVAVEGGLIFGFGVWLVLLNLVVMPLTGAGVFGRRMGVSRLSLVTLGMHLLYGVIVSLIYRP